MTNNELKLAVGEDNKKTELSVEQPSLANKIPKLLLLAALLVAIIFDRLLIIDIFTIEYEVFFKNYALFWLSFFGVFTVFYWKKMVNKPVVWPVSIACVALCLWYFFFTANTGNMEFAFLNFLVLPAVLMALAQFIAGDYDIKDVKNVALAWLIGWFIKPFSGLLVFIGNLSDIVAGENKRTLRKVGFALLLTLPLLVVLVGLLSGADLVFKYYLDNLFSSWDVTSFFRHSLIILIATALIYSFLWNIGFGNNNKIETTIKLQFDEVSCYVVLISIITLYCLFCGIQFTYLFAKSGLPAGLTYSEYARAGFSQTLLVCTVNLLIYSVFLKYGEKKAGISALLLGLLATTAVMLVSGFVRLDLYIVVYGFTWLRLLSGWFVIYLAAVIIIGVIRMFIEKLPAIALAFLILVGWYVALGFSNPDRLVAEYNQRNNHVTAVHSR